MRIVSLLPSATEIVFALGLGDELVGVTHECDFPPTARDLPVMTRTAGGVSRGTARVDPGAVPGPARPGPAPWSLDVAALAAARPDLVLTHGPSRGFADGYRAVSEAAHGLDGDVTVIGLEPTSIEGILNSIQTVGAMTEAEDAAVDLVEQLRERLRAVEEIVAGRRAGGFAPPRVAAIEWLDPPFAVGYWIPEQVRRAGGWELLGREGGEAGATSWDAIREVDPEVLVVMPRTLHLAETVRAWADLPRPAGWDELRATRDGRVFAVDGAGCFARPSPRVVDGIELLAELIDPLAFDGMAPPETWARVG